MPIDITCPCGIVFKVKPYTLKRGRGKYCSKACDALGRTKQQTLICIGCGAPFERTPSEIAYGKTKYCSQACFHAQPKSDDLDQQFWAHILKNEQACWGWIGAHTTAGYGTTRYCGEQVYIHRLSWQIHYGPIPEGMNILHRCDNPECARPDHLALGTQADNIHDMVHKNRTNNAKGEDHFKARLNEEQVRQIRRKYATGRFSQLELAEEYQMGRTTISQIVTRKIWRHI